MTMSNKVSSMVHMPFCCPNIIHFTPLQANEKKPKSAAKKDKVKKGKKKASFRRSHKKRPREEPSVGGDGGEEEAVVPHASRDESESESEAIWPKKSLWYWEYFIRKLHQYLSACLFLISCVKKRKKHIFHQYKGTFSQERDTPHPEPLPLRRDAPTMGTR